jgi:perosamine synthetase
MVCSNNSLLIDKVRHLKNQAVSLTEQYQHDAIGYNYRMTNICAAIGLAQLEQANSFLEKKRNI